MQKRNLNQHKLHHLANEMMDMVDGNLDTFFLETQQQAGTKMSMEAYQTMEIKQAHQAFAEAWSFEKSPIMNEVNNLPKLNDGILSN